MEALTHFSDVTGLQANMDKSNLFLAGVDDQTKDQLVMKTGSVLGTLPIRYLDLPLSSKGWSKMECQQLIDKITSKITSAYSKQLSYAGRLQIINDVLFSIHSFWSSVFILPQSVLKNVDKKCRDYLWGSTEEARKVSWEQVCIPKKFGGLNIKGSKLWNMASVGRLLWQLAVKEDVLWIKWVFGVYMKNNDNIVIHTPPLDSSWYWKKVNALKVEMQIWCSLPRETTHSHRVIIHYWGNMLDLEWLT
ncbi:hypothetical protein KY290_006150 [Solanum tuberosum]|uniref:Non-LTR retroelement reverse transcriptase n=1 Tax=Solanum tuberosum TaxID=4113 RepID=A0ABQ7WG56_SOLTU|nr:hypothetical protein KY284_006263 [Solanum tuberosum]KAH0779723.1 hypothetical protein KY290_006150 [Solanum tuberosum]